MSILSSFYGRSASDAGLLALIPDGDSSSSADPCESTPNIKLYPDQAPHSAALPYVVYNRISHRHERDLSGASGIAQIRIQVDCYAASRTGAQELYDAFREAWDGNLRVTIGDTFFHSASVDDDSDDETLSVDADEFGRFRTRLDILIWHSESTPSPT